MPIKIRQNLRARNILESENIFVMTESRAITQDIRPLKILVLNLMPKKVETETQILRKLSNTPLQLEIEFLKTATYQSQNVDIGYLDELYKTFYQVNQKYYDGLIITGAPLDFIDYKDVDYWEEVCEIMEWSKTHVHCTFYLCWGAFAGLFYHYGIRKRDRLPKLSGVYPHRILNRTSPLFRGFDDIFYGPHSRATEITRDQILATPELELMAESDEAGVAIVKTVDSRQFYVFCHLEYDADTLKLEYERDIEKGRKPEVPFHYFPNDDVHREPIVNWRSAGQLLWTNWINYYVYQTTPYDVDDVKKEN